MNSFSKGNTGLLDDNTPDDRASILFFFPKGKDYADDGENIPDNYSSVEKG
jgi:hypothetical protein